MDAIWAHIIRFSSGSIFPHVSSKLFIICHLFRISAFPAQTHTHHLSSFEVCRIFHRWICLIMIYEWGSVQPSQHVIDSAYYISGTSRTERRERDEQKAISLFSSIRIKPSKCNNILCTRIRILFFPFWLTYGIHECIYYLHRSFFSLLISLFFFVFLHVMKMHLHLMWALLFMLVNGLEDEKAEFL